MEIYPGEIVFVKDNWLSKEGSYGMVLRDEDGFHYIIFDNATIEFVGDKLIEHIKDTDIIPNTKRLNILYTAYKNFCCMHNIKGEN
jgi:hypothetical protein